MAQRKTGRIFGALALLAVFLPLATLSGCKLLNREKKAFGEDCAADTDCDSLECATYGSVCTKGCSYDKDCGAGFVCRAHDGSPGDSCAKPTGNPTGQACNNAAECQSGNCLKPVGQETGGFCSTHCDTEVECPDGYKTCLSISDSGALKFCLPGNGPGSAAIGGPNNEPPKFVAPRPVATTVKTVTTTSTTTTPPAATTTTPPATTASVKPTASTTASAAPTIVPTATATTKPTTTTTGTAKRPPIILRPKGK